MKKMLLSPAAMTWLGSAFTEKTSISPLTTIQVPGFAEADKAELVKEGIIDREGAVTADSFALLETLAKAEAFAGFRVNGAFGYINKTAYFHEDKIVTVDSAGELLTVSNHVDVGTMTGILNEITGTSRLINAEVNIKLGIKSALAFGALIDITRKHALSQYAGFTQMPVGYTAGEILPLLLQAEGSHWITAYVKKLRLPSSILIADDFEAAMTEVLEANYAEKGDYGYRLIGEAYDLAANFLIIENVINVRCGQEANGRIVTGEALFLQAGLHDLLMLDMDAETVEFNTVSTYIMMEYLQSMMLKAPDLR